jgi:molecular chaperone DnaK
MILTRPIGIDLGTTNSAVAMLDTNERDLILWRDVHGRPIVPSCVWRDPKTGEIVVGFAAYARKGTRPEPIASIKRSMGTQLTVSIGDEQASAAKVSSYILMELKRRMEAELARRSATGVRYDVSRAIVTVPAYFDLPAIEATRLAGEQAGLKISELLHEPTAAAIYYCWKRNLGDGVYLVYDLGGGTFDVSMLRRISGEFMVLGIAGDNFLGGDDFDRRLAEHLRQLLVNDGYELDLDVASDPEDQLRFKKLTVMAEEVKKGLSDEPEYLLRNQGSLVDKAGIPVVVETVITRDTFECLIGDLLDRTIAACRVALDRATQTAGVTVEDVGHVVLVGGSTYVPAVMRKVEDALCGGGAGRAKCATPIRDDPDTAVALGAALRAAASGLGVGDDAGTVRLWFRSSGASRREHSTISGVVEPLGPGLALENCTLTLSSPSGKDLGEVRLDAGMRFSFPRVELQSESLNDFRFTVIGSSGEVLAVVDRSILHAADQKEAVGRALSTAVLSKPILLEGVDGERLVRTVLLPEGAPLPAKASFTFYVGDPSGHIRLPVYQLSRIIKELSADFGPVRAGTPVDVEIACDEQVRIDVRFSLNGKSFGGKIEPPPPDSVPTEFQIQEIGARFKGALRSLDEADAERLSAQYASLRGDAEEALRGGDYPKLIQRVADLEAMVREARMAEPLSPPLQSVEKQHQTCMELLQQAAQVKPGIESSSLVAELEKALGKARDAYARRERREYEDATQSIATARQYLTAIAQARTDSDDPDADVAVRASFAFQQTLGITQMVLMQCMFAGRREFIGALTKQLAELQTLNQQLDANPIDVLHRCQILDTEARRIHQQIAGEEKRAADLQGLLQVEGKSYAGEVGAGSSGIRDH